MAANLAVPTRFNRTTSKAHYRRNATGISWFRDSAHEHITRIHDLARIGFVVYEDEHQVVAEPFANTAVG